ncbi:MAG: heat-inducible transcriptional repressor HrcA [Myxococcota bacterium]
MGHELNYRRRRILYALLSEYIATGEPVGSRKLAKRYGLNLSPATIRNVLADLEELGYLIQPHASAGRVPTGAGFRVFVDALVQFREVSSDDQAAIARRLQGLSPQDDVLRETGRLLSALAGAAAVIASPRPDEEILEEIRFLRLRSDQVLAVLVLQGGAVQNRVLRLDEQDCGPSELERINNYLAARVSGASLVSIRQRIASEVAGERNNYDELRRQAARIIDDLGDEAGPVQVVIEGQSELFDRPEFSNVDTIKGYLRAFEDREHLLSLLDRTILAGGVQVVIGAEAQIEAVEDISLIAASYRKSASAVGTLGVIGPARMDYAKLMPLVAFTAQYLTELHISSDEA